TAADQLDALLLRALLLLGGKNGKDRDPIDLELRVGAHDIAGLGSGVEDGPVKHAARLEGAGCPPCPCAVGPRACQLDLDPAGHEIQPTTPGWLSSWSGPSSRRCHRWLTGTLPWCAHRARSPRPRLRLVIRTQLA